MGELHLEVIVDRLLREHKLELNVGKPQVSYREGVSGTTQISGEVNQELGGRLQQGKLKIILAESDADEVSFVSKVDSRSVPLELIKSVESAILNSAPGGIDLGYPMIKTSVTLQDLTYVEGETTELGLAMAISKCFQQLRFSKNVQTFQPVMVFL